MGCLSCCGTFCLGTSIFCALMQFVFYAMISSDSQRIHIGHSTEERESFKDTALWTGVVYSVFVILSIMCLVVPRKQDPDRMGGGEIDERSSLVHHSDARQYQDQQL
eukprot:354848_1